MKRSSIVCLVIAATMLFPGIAAASKEPAQPTAVLFYPNEIHLTVEERLKPEAIPGKGQGLRIILPAGAARATFSAIVDNAPANSFYWLDAPDEPVILHEPRLAPQVPAAGLTLPEGAGKPGAGRQELLDAITAIQDEMDRKTASMKARKARLALWENLDSSDEKFTPDDILKLDNAFAERLADLYAAESKDERDLESLRQRLEKAGEALRLHDAENALLVAVIPFAGPETEAVLVRYSYILPGSSSTAYRLTAYPAKETLVIEQDVTLFQNTGKTWNDVDVYISTTRRDTAVRPSTLSPWRIALRSKDAPAPSPRMKAPVAEAMAPNMVQMAEMQEMRRQAPAAPAQTEMGTFRLWSLGKKTIDSNVAVTLPLAKDEYAATYYYTLQPSINPKGFLTASLSLDSALELPQGKARLFVDNVAIGEQTLSINGSRVTLYFGTDPQVTATMRDVKRTSGEKGIISKEQSQLWDWEIAVRNTRSRPVTVWVEDPLPDEQDTAIKLAVESTPKPEKATTATQLGATKVYRWTFTLQPNEMQTIRHKVEINAPADKILQSGRSR